MEKKIKVVIKTPEGEAYDTEIEDTYKMYSDLVDGMIEIIDCPTVSGVKLVLNEEGKIDGLAPNIYLPENGDLLVGTFIAVGDGRYGNFKSLTDTQIEKVKAYIANNNASGYDGDVMDHVKTEVYSLDNEEAFLNALLGDTPKNKRGAEM